MSEQEKFVAALAPRTWMEKDGTHCVRCREPFGKHNVFTDAGWSETNISGLCERCFDSLFPPEFPGEALKG